MTKSQRKISAVNKCEVYVKFPKAGLGNMLLTWSRAYIFAHLNNLDLHTSSWTAIHAGVWLRGERKKRLYVGYFKEESLLKRLKRVLFTILKQKEFEPPVIKFESLKANTVFIFNKIFTDPDFFKEVRPYRELVHEGLLKMLNPSLKRQFDEYEKPIIGIHIRRGDFKKGSTLTPLAYFVDVVNGIRKEVGEDLPVTIFTDAEKDEINSLLELKAVKLAESKPDILDILLLASSQILVLSIGSSFSYWAAFLSCGIIIRHPNEWHVPFSNVKDDFFQKEITWKGSFKCCV